MGERSPTWYVAPFYCFPNHRYIAMSVALRKKCRKLESLFARYDTDKDGMLTYVLTLVLLNVQLVANSVVVTKNLVKPFGSWA